MAVVSFDITSAMGAASGIQYDLLLAHDPIFLND
jgi:hypothetical protein